MYVIHPYGLATTVAYYTFIRHFVKRRSQKLLRCLTLPDYPGVGALAVDWLGASWLQSTGSLLTLTIDRQGCCPGWIFWDLLGWLPTSEFFGQD